MEASINSFRVFVDFFICRLIYDMFLFNYLIFSVFPVLFTFFFVSRVFLHFSFSKATSCSRYIQCHSRKLEFLSNLGLENSPYHCRAYQLISLLNFLNSATNILYNLSLTRSFSSVQSWSTWCDKTMVFF